VRVAFGTDEETALTAALVAHLSATGHTVVFSEVASWPDVGRSVADSVASGAAERGVVCCCAALCTDAETARGARRWNDANVLALGLRLTSDAVGCEIVDAFLEGECDEGEGPLIARLEPRVDH
jgi:ribose 5-phosphate isomerase B